MVILQEFLHRWMQKFERGETRQQQQRREANKELASDDTSHGFHGIAMTQYLDSQGFDSNAEEFRNQITGEGIDEGRW